MKKILIFILILTLPIVIILTNFRLIIFNQHYYAKQFSEHKVYSKIPEADMIITNIIAYFKNKDKELNVKVFTENELSHMKDVKQLIHKVLIFYYVLLILDLLIIYIILKNDLTNAVPVLLFSGLIILLFSISLYFVRNLFPVFFIKFHEIFFPQGNWIFPESSKLVTLFPESFFYNTVFIIFFRSFIIGVIFILIAILLSLSRKK